MGEETTKIDYNEMDSGELADHIRLEKGAEAMALIDRGEYHMRQWLKTENKLEDLMLRAQWAEQAQATAATQIDVLSAMLRGHGASRRAIQDILGEIFDGELFV